MDKDAILAPLYFLGYIHDAVTFAIASDFLFHKMLQSLDSLTAPDYFGQKGRGLSVRSVECQGLSGSGFRQLFVTMTA
ncbi:asparagine synthetase Asn2 [Aspergillus luchuensis]|uniref:Asparagine synthetase Asn2 n=1 Tax=Aspergillus kawachii TaxID=1069201 RepID=A0A146F4F0_ASPKA|nr:asparagine synthetase Asn2 [Aspergillus luchuensis]